MKNDPGSSTELNKKKLRDQVRAKRDALAPIERKKRSEIIVRKFFLIEDYRKSTNILLYYPFRSEIDTTIIIKRALRDGKKVILPRVGTRGLELFFIDDISLQLEKGSYGIMEPIPGSCGIAKTADIDLVIVPGVSFDKKLNRLGYGGGFYDRLLQKINRKVHKISLCFEMQISEKIPISEHDIKVDLLITESNTYYSGSAH